MDRDYVSLQLTMELDPEQAGIYESMELQQGAMTLRFISPIHSCAVQAAPDTPPCEFDDADEAFFHSAVNTDVLLEDEEPGMMDRAHVAVARVAQRARALISHNSPLRA